ncbi:putative armadillo-like helical, condensin subunit 1/Condensin-2 complex subunit D3 [Dioscorea sansibarensis]
MAAETEEPFVELLSEVESLHRSHSSAPLSDSSLHPLISGDVGDRLWDLLAARNLPPAAVLRPLSASMDTGSLPASLAYLSLLLLPSSPLSSLLSPLPLLSLLRSLRLSSKPQSDPPSNLRKRKSSSRSQNGDLDPPALFIRVLESLESVLSRVCLNSTTDGRRSLIETLAGILTAAQHGQHHKVQDQCFRILYVVISRPEHGDQSTSTVEVLRSLAPIILSPSKTPSRGLALGFVTRKVAPLSRENDEVRKALMYLPRYLAMKSPEKSEPRSFAVDAIMEVVKAMEDEDRISFAEFAVKMGSGKSHLRLLAVDLFPHLLTLLPASMENEDDWVMKCLEALVNRCSDSIGTIRARALTNMAQVIGVFLMDANKVDRLKEVVAFGNSGFVELLRRRCVDEKAVVRKAALLLITKSTALMTRPVDDVILRTMGIACSDPLVSIRKAALSALSEVFRRFPDSRVIDEWLHAVPGMIVDNETSIQEECENFFLELIFDCISRVGKMNLTDDTMDMESPVPKVVLDLLKGVCDGEIAPCIMKICASLGKKKKLKGSIAISLQQVISSSETLWLRNSMPIEKWAAPAGAWQLLSEVSLFTPKSVSWEFLHHHWQLVDKANLKERSELFDGVEANSASWAGDRVYLLQTISNVSIELPPEPAADLAHNLLKRIEDFNMNLSEVDAHVKALKTLCKRKATDPKESETLILKWVRQLLSKAVKILNSYISEVSDSSKANSFQTPPQTRSGRTKRKKETAIPKSLQQAVVAVFSVGSLILVCPSADLQGVIPLLHTIVTSSSSEAKTKKLAGLTVSLKEKAPSLYTQSWVTLGKICLVDGKLAKRYIPLFVQELERSDCAALRNNITVVMADFCVRYTALVDWYVSYD